VPRQAENVPPRLRERCRCVLAGKAVRHRPPGTTTPEGLANGKRNDFIRLRLGCCPRRFTPVVARPRGSWPISSKARGTSHLNCHREDERTQWRPKHFPTNERPKNSLKRNCLPPQMSIAPLSITISHTGQP